MVAEAADLSARVIRAVLLAVSAQAWPSVRPVPGDPEPASPEARRFREELDSVAGALSDPSGILDGPSRRYVLQTCQSWVRTSLQETPELAAEVRAFVTTVERAMQRTPKSAGEPGFLLNTYAGDPIPQITMGSPHRFHDAGEAPDQAAAWDSFLAQRSELLGAIQMEFSGERAKGARKAAFPYSLAWQPPMPAGLIDPPLDLLPADLYGKKDALSWLENALGAPDGNIHLLCGEPGTGKRITALAAAAAAKERGRQVWWVRGTPELISAGMTAVALHLNADPAAIAEAQAGRRSLPDLVWGCIEHVRDPWLLIFDDVGDRGGMQRFMSGDAEGSGWIRPSRSGIVVVTSRYGGEDTALRRLIAHRVTPFTSDDAVRFLLSSAPAAGSAGDAAELAEYLKRLPLACRLAARYIAAPATKATTFRGCLAQLQETNGTQITLSHHAERSWLGLSTRIVLQSMDLPEHASAWTLLAILSYCAPGAPVASAVLDPDVLAEVGVTPWAGDEDNRSLSDSLELLISLGLIESTTARGPHDPAGKRNISMHPLLSDTCRLLVEKQPNVANVHQDQIWVAAATLLHRAAQRHSDATGPNWLGGFELAPHISALVASLPANSPPAAVQEAVRAARLAMDHLDRTGAHQQAEHLGRRALNLSRKLPEDNPAALRVACDLARILINHGRLGEAEEILQDVLETCQRELGLEHEASLDALELLASSLHQHGDVDQSEQMLRQVIRGRERTDGPEAATTIRALAALARILSEQGKLGEMERLTRSVLTTVRARYGSGNLETLSAEADLGATFRALGRLSEAEQILRQVLDAQTSVLGPDHPQTCNTQAELAETFRDQGQLALAEATLIDVLAKRSEVLGADSPAAINAMAELAETYRDQAKYQQSEELLRQVLQARRRILGPEHAETLNAKIGLAVVLRDTGKFAHAEHTLDQVIATCISSIGVDHPIALSARHNLATIFQATGRIDQAEQLYRDVLDKREWMLGPNHPETLRTLVNLGSLLQLRGSLDDAGHALRQAEAAYNEIYGTHHPHTMTVRNNIANVLLDSAVVEEARQIYRDTLDTQRAILGHDHPDTLITTVNLAVALAIMGELHEAESLLARAISGYERLFGAGDHPNLLTARYHLASVQERKGDFVAALKGYRGILSLQTGKLGERHPDAIATRISISRVLESLGQDEESVSEYQQAISLASKHPRRHRTHAP